MAGLLVGLNEDRKNKKPRKKRKKCNETMHSDGRAMSFGGVFFLLLIGGAFRRKQVCKLHWVSFCLDRLTFACLHSFFFFFPFRRIFTIIRISKVLAGKRASIESECKVHTHTHTHIYNLIVSGHSARLRLRIEDCVSFAVFFFFWICLTYHIHAGRLPLHLHLKVAHSYWLGKGTLAGVHEIHDVPICHGRSRDACNFTDSDRIGILVGGSSC